MSWITPPECQGQIVVYSYRLAEDGTVYQSVHDQSEQTTLYYASKSLADDEGDYWNGAPRNKRWRKVTAQEAETIIP